MAKKSKSQKAVEAKKEAIITMKALQEQSDSDDDGDDSAWPPESEWNAEATALRKAIEAGTFDTLLQQGKKSKNDDDASFEEVDLEDEDDDEDDSVENVAKNQTQTLGHGSKSNNQDVGDEEEDEEVDDESDDEDGENIADEESEGHEDDMDDIEKEEELELDDELEDDNDEDDADDTDGIGRSSNKSDQEEEDDDDDDESESDDENDGRFTHSNSSNQALKIVLGDMIAEKRDWPWAETFSVITSTPLPFDDKKAGSNILAEEPLRPSIHDDLQREVAFYNLAVEAAEQVKVFCREAQVPFSRPDDFLAEMVKTDGKFGLCVAWRLYGH